MVRIAAALAWYDESPAFLERMVLSLAGTVDEVVALDGRWRGYDDGGRSQSTPEEHDAIANACIAAGLDARIVACNKPWDSQVAKRARLMELAAETADWILVIDGDEWLQEADSRAVRSALQLTGRDVAEIMLQRVNEPWPTRDLEHVPIPVRRVYRALDEDGTPITVETAHNGYRLGSKWLHGDRAHVRLVEAVDLSAAVLMHHDGDRGEERRARQKAYYVGRQNERVESWR